MTRIEIAEEALKLSLEERLELAYALWHSVDSDALPLHPWQREILDERLDRAQRDSDPWIGWEEARAQVLAALTKRRGA